MTEEKKGVALRELYWKTLVLGSHQPEEFDGGRFRSQPNESYPMDIVLGLDQIANVYKVVIDVDDEFVPSRVTIRVGLGQLGLPIDYKHARLARFGKAVVMEFYRRDRAMSRMETRNAFTDAIGQYVWLTINGPLDHPLNPHRLVAIQKLTVLGYPFSKEDIAKMTPKPTEQVELPPRVAEPPPSRPASSQAPQKSPYRPLSSAQATRPKPNVQSEGDGMQMKGSSPLGDDPLSSLRTIRRVLEEKAQRSRENGRTVEATVCLRATQRIDEYEARIEDLAMRRSNALVMNDTVMAERHRLAMIDCRDTVLRAVHVDLLLNRDELRAIGVSSSWSED